jgi:hypothetical protein
MGLFEKKRFYCLRIPDIRVIYKMRVNIWEVKEDRSKQI